MVTDYTEYIWDQINETVRECQRHLMRGVLPRHVQAWLPYARAEGSLRRDMAAMWKRGELVRCGRRGSRKGYRVPTPEERLLWEQIPALAKWRGRVDVQALAASLEQDVATVRTVVHWLADVGKLVPLGGGMYKAPSAIERLAWRQCGGWPYGVAAA